MKSKIKCSKKRCHVARRLHFSLFLREYVCFYPNCSERSIKTNYIIEHTNIHLEKLQEELEAHFFGLSFFLCELFTINFLQCSFSNKKFTVSDVRLAARTSDVNPFTQRTNGRNPSEK